MKAVQILGDVSSPKITVNDSLIQPKPTGSEILIRVHAAGITGDEVLWPEVYTTPSRIPGHDISGVIAALGPDYSGPLELGQEVFAFIAAERGQGQAQYAICLPNEVAPKPKSITHEEAAALPIPLLTAWEAIVDHCKIQSGMRVFVSGASGAVGQIAVQLLTQQAGAHVIALASSHNHHTLKALGAQELFDYKVPGWENHIKDVDAVLDTVGGDVLSKSWDIVKADGVIATVADPPPPWAFEKSLPDEHADRPHVRYKYFVVSPNMERLLQASELIDMDSFKPLAITSYPLKDAEMAWEVSRQRGHGKKVVITMLENDE
ncbi:zinc-binding dehydrogenase [Colletotrichum truncatum]|uniref:Zinc-binding dehydrogenase n=1 Tax=Colletotrichum truncatum TaxID=5467 RepID=A0ACC3YWM0_COLTU|nr:zinc-binding dehydrogenase [Colletotrichum truncatum]KAF6787359.1 zinc-binding dehydrogenase [Colletotrichum truncatum]